MTPLAEPDHIELELKARELLASWAKVPEGMSSHLESPALSQGYLFLLEQMRKPIPMLLTCPIPACGARHIDKGLFATTKLHHTHACQVCGHVWRPAIQNTVGVQFLPGFKDALP